ncbi:MAG TPA: hypothetical protein DCW48_06890, partial [Methylotenera mobilis]|nr:hypothetical protein [Methylotenera mobilis]
HVALENIQLQTKPDLAPLMLDRLSGNITWKNLNKNKLLGTASKFGHSLSVNALNASTANGFNIKALSANYSQTIKGEQNFNLSMPGLGLTNIQTTLSQLPIPEKLLAFINAANPQGE